MTALNPGILCCKTGNEKNKLLTHFGPLLPSCQTCFGIVCLHVSALPVSDQIRLLHAFSVLQIYRSRAQQQQRTNHNEHVWNTLQSRLLRFAMVLQKNATIWKLITCMNYPYLWWQQIAFGKMWPKSCQGLSSFSRVRSCHWYFSLFGFWFRIEDCQLVALFRTITEDSFNRSSRQLKKVRTNIVIACNCMIVNLVWESFCMHCTCTGSIFLVLPTHG